MTDQDSLPNSSDSNSIRLGGHVVGLFDVLGQRDVLRSWKTPKERDPAVRAQLVEQLKKTWGVIHSFRRGFRDAFEAFSAEPNLSDKIPPEKQELWKSLSNHPLKLFGFSDTVVAHLAVETSQHKAPTRGVLGLIAATGLMQLHQLSTGNPIRGGIDLEIAFEIDKDEIYGPALMRAYALESETAEYPRVVIGDELMRWLQGAAKANKSTIDKFNQRLAQRTLDEFICADIDDRPMVDFLGPGVRNLNSSANPVNEVVVKAAGFVSNELDRLRSARDMKLALRYARLKDYFIQRLPDWNLGGAVIFPRI